MQRVKTESGSVYDVDRRGMRIRRVHGKHGPADAQPQDGIWRRMAGIEGPVIGEAMVVYWAKEAPGARQTDFGFRTTTVVEVHELESVDGPGEPSGSTGDTPAGAGTASAPAARVDSESAGPAVDPGDGATAADMAGAAPAAAASTGPDRTHRGA